MRESSHRWQKILAQGFSSAEALLDYLGLPKSLGCDQAEQAFATRVPRGYAARMVHGDAMDPLLRQVLAQPIEMLDVPSYVKDPLLEQAYNPEKGLIHKYHSRVLLTLTGACAINCRYCFRRHFPYQDNNPGRAGWTSVLNYIRDNPQLNEVILSGGDPLLAPDARLMALMTEIASISHIKTLRIHSRIPIVLPERISTTFQRSLAAIPLNKVVVLHSNHPNEIDETVALACQRLRQAGCHLLNQSVLLAGVNDDVDILANLSERLFSIGVLPYYLHLLDKVAGAAHFDLPHERSLAIFRALQVKLAGYLVPRLACEEPGVAHKTLFL